MDIGSIVSARLKAARALESNPHDVEALTLMHRSQTEVSITGLVFAARLYKFFETEVSITGLVFAARLYKFFETEVSITGLVFAARLYKLDLYFFSLSLFPSIRIELYPL